MKRLIIANWKMNPSTPEKAKRLFNSVAKETAKIKKAKIVIAPPFVFLPFFKGKNLALAAQDVFWKDFGAYTGEISAPMLKSLGARYAIIGHSERREWLRETDEMINKKIKEALRSGLKAVFCVGERDRSDENFQNFVREELRIGLEGLNSGQARNLVVAYEPVWAIGAGKTASPGDLFEMITYIRRALLDILGKKSAYQTPILYGGSVNAQNASQFVNEGGADGLLVGGASLSAEEFIGIVRSV